MGYVIYQQMYYGRRYVDQDNCQRDDISDAKVWYDVPAMVFCAYRLRNIWRTPYVFWEQVSDRPTVNPSETTPKGVDTRNQAMLLYM